VLFVEFVPLGEDMVRFAVMVLFRSVAVMLLGEICSLVVWVSDP
jgi:hypothetical protein